MAKITIDTEDLAFLLQFVPAWKEIKDIPRLIKLVQMLDTPDPFFKGGVTSAVYSGETLYPHPHPEWSQVQNFGKGPYTQVINSGFVLQYPKNPKELQAQPSDPVLASGPAAVAPGLPSITARLSFHYDLDANIIERIKAVRSLTKMPLKEAKDFVESGALSDVFWVLDLHELWIRYNEYKHTGLVITVNEAPF